MGAFLRVAAMRHMRESREERLDERERQERDRASAQRDEAR